MPVPPNACLTLLLGLKGDRVQASEDVSQFQLERLRYFKTPADDHFHVISLGFGRLTARSLGRSAGVAWKFRAPHKCPAGVQA